MKKLLLSVMLTFGFASGAMAGNGPFIVGMMNGGQDYGSSITELQQFEAASGIIPPVYNTYMDLGDTYSGGSTWAGSAGYIAGLMGGTSPYNQGCPSHCAFIPMIGMPITTTAYSNSQDDQLLQQTAAGNYDSIIKGYIDDFNNQGFKTQYWRPGVEMNYSSTPGDIVGSQEADWIAAWKHIYTIMHQEAAADGVTLKMIWNAGLSGAQPTGNPTSGLGSNPAGGGFWPGKAYVDVIGGDLYSDLYPQGGSNPYDWAANGQKYGGSIYDSSLAQFASNPINLEHYYSFNDSNASGPDEACPNNGNGYAAGAECGGTFDLLNMIYWAHQQGLPIATPETGTDQGNGGPVDNPTFPLWLAAALSYAVGEGVPVTVMSIWDDPSGCTCSFTPTTGDGSTVTATAWTNSFGANAPAVPPNVASIIGVSGATGGTGASTAANTQVNGPSGTIYTTSSNAWTISVTGQLEENGAAIASATNVVTMYWTGTILDYRTTAGTWYNQPLSGGTATTTTAPTGYVAPHAASAANAQVNGFVSVLYDTFGNTWSINLAGNILENGSPVPVSSNVVTLLWTGTALDQMNSAGGWYTQPLDGSEGTSITAPAGYTVPHAASAANAQVNGTSGVIYDTYGNTWAINGTQNITANGVQIPVSSNVTNLFWTGTALDQNTSSSGWYTQPLDGSEGTSISAPAGFTTAPTTISVSPATSTVSTTDVTPANPFTGLVISDPNANQTETATVSLSNTANGVLSDPKTADGATVSGGVLHVTGTVASVTAALNDTIFTPTQNQVAIGSSVTTTVTAAIGDSDAETTSAVSTVTATQVHAASPANTQVNGTAGTIYDNSGNAWAINANQLITENGTPIPVSSDVVTLFWTGTALFQLNTSGNWYTQPLTGAAGVATTAPAGYNVAAVAITVTPAKASVSGTDVATVNPFSNIAITDGNANQTETATVSVSNTANGTLSDPNASTDGSSITGGVLTMSGTAAAVDTALDGVVFTPHQNQVAAGASVTTTVTAAIADTAGNTTSTVSTLTIAQVHAASAANTQVNGTSGTIYDTNGNAWTINSGQQIEENGTVLSFSANVTTLFWTGTTLYQLTSSGVWYLQPLNGTAGAETTAPTGYTAPTSGTTTPAGPPPLASAYSFINSLGVNVHISQGTGDYDSLSADEADLAYLGVHNLRDSYNPYWEAYQHSYSTLSSVSGVKWDMISTVGSDSSPPTESAANVTSFLSQTSATTGGAGGIGYLDTEVAGSIYAVEGPNEINNFAINYNTGTSTDTGLQAGVDFQTALYSQTKAASWLSGVKVFYFTGYNAGSIGVGPNPYTTSGLADYDTQHPYPGTNSPPFASVTPSVALGNETAPFGPAVYTETGYNTDTGGITQAAMGAWILDIFADDWYDGISKTYIYQMMSDSTSDGSGFYSSANVQTTAATDLHNFTTLLTDAGSGASTFSPTANITYTLSGAGAASAKVIALQKSSGETDLVIWNETSAYPGAASPVTVSFGATVASANVFDPTTGTTATSTNSSVPSVSLNLTGSPQIVEVTPGAGAPTPISITPATGAITITNPATGNPFAGMAITDANASQTETATVSLSAAHGALSDPNSGSDHSTISGGVLTVSGSASAVAADLDGLVFTPAANATAGSSVTTTVTASITDTAGQTASATSTVIATQPSVNAPPPSFGGDQPLPTYATGIAAAGTGFSTATPLSMSINVISTCTSGGVSLPSVPVGTTIRVDNRCSNNAAVSVYPDSASNTIESGAAGAAVTTNYLSDNFFTKVTATHWVQ
jgi:hypothetical protein